MIDKDKSSQFNMKFHMKIEDEDPEIETKERSKSRGDSPYESYESSTNPSRFSRNSGMRNTVSSEKVASVSELSEVEGKIEELMERRGMRFYCQACDYSSLKSGHMKEHVERHIEGLSYSCQFCEKKFRRRQFLRKHVSAYHK